MDRFKKKTDENGERTSLNIKISMRKTAKMISEKRGDFAVCNRK